MVGTETRRTGLVGPAGSGKRMAVWHVAASLMGRALAVGAWARGAEVWELGSWPVPEGAWHVAAGLLREGLITSALC